MLNNLQSDCCEMVHVIRNTYYETIRVTTTVVSVVIGEYFLGNNLTNEGRNYISQIAALYHFPGEELSVSLEDWEGFAFTTMALLHVNEVLFNELEEGSFGSAYNSTRLYEYVTLINQFESWFEDETAIHRLKRGE